MGTETTEKSEKSEKSEKGVGYTALEEVVHLLRPQDIVLTR